MDSLDSQHILEPFCLAFRPFLDFFSIFIPQNYSLFLKLGNSTMMRKGWDSDKLSQSFWGILDKVSEVLTIQISKKTSDLIFYGIQSWVRAQR